MFVKFLHILLVVSLLIAYLPLQVSAFSSLQNKLSFVSVNVDQGLSQSHVQAIEQDNLGFIWIGTKDGLNRYDGSSFTVYKHTADDKSIANNNVVALQSYPDGNLFIGLQNGLLNKYICEDDNFEQISPEIFSGGSIKDIYLDNNKRLWVASDKGIYVSNEKGQDFSLFDVEKLLADEDSEQIDPNDLMLHEQKTLTKEDAFYGVNKIVTGRNNSLWLATRAGLIHYNHATRLMRLYVNENGQNPLRNNNFTSICLLADGNILLGTETNGLFLFNPGTNSFSQFKISCIDPAGKIGQNITTIIQDFNSLIWIGTDDQGLFIVHPLTGLAQKYDSSVSLLTPKSDLNNDRITCLSLAKFNRIFIGTVTGGLNIYDNNWISIPHIVKKFDGLRSNTVYGFTSNLKRNSIWIATAKGLSLWNKNSNTYKNYIYEPDNPKSINSNRCTGIYRDKDDILWVFTTEGVARYNPAQDNFDRLNPGSDNNGKEINPSSIKIVLQDSNKNYWYGTEKGLIFHNKARGIIIRYTHNSENPNSIIGDNINHLYEDSLGYIWIATDNGLSCYTVETGEFKNFTYSPKAQRGLGSNIINAFFEDSNYIWLGTMNGGLNRYDKKTGEIEIITFAHDGSNTTVYAIEEDSQGLLWLATNKGLQAFDRSTNKISMHFVIKDGVQSYEFNPGASFKTESDEIFFGGINGFNHFSAKNMKRTPSFAPIVCTGLSINHEPVKNFSKYITTVGNIALDYTQTRLFISFTMLDYQIEGVHKYMYKLEGHDPDWVQTTLNHVSYEKLPAGEYTLLVKGAGADGIWNENPLTVKIEVSPPPWRSKFAMLIYAFLFFAVLRHIVLTQRKKNEANEERNRRLNKTIEEKTWELQISVQLLDEKNRKLYFLTMHDELTGFFNRKRFSDVEEDISKGLFVDKMPFCIIVADIDGLKLTNDHLGHMYGDRLIKEVARMFRFSLRDEDIACRIGGDEFALIIPNCTEKTLNAILSRIEEEQNVYNKNSNNDLYIHISTGYSFLDKNDGFKEAFEAADEMMYEKKKANKASISKLIMEKIQTTKERLQIK